MAAAFASACLAGGGLCKKGAKCEPDPNSCMGRGTNTLYGYIVANAHDASWNGEYSPGDPIQYLDNARRYDLGGVKSRGRTLALARPALPDIVLIVRLTVDGSVNAIDTTSVTVGGAELSPKALTDALDRARALATARRDLASLFSRGGD